MDTTLVHVSLFLIHTHQSTSCHPKTPYPVRAKVVNGGVLYVDEGATATFMGTAEFTDNSVANEALEPVSCGEGCITISRGESYVVKKGAAVHNKVTYHLRTAAADAIPGLRGSSSRGGVT